MKNNANHARAIQKFDLFCHPEKKVDFSSFPKLQAHKKFFQTWILIPTLKSSKRLTVAFVWFPLVASFLTLLGLRIGEEPTCTVFVSQYLVQYYCSTTKMNTRSQAASPPSQPPLSTETFEELMEISQLPHENQDLHCRVSLLETQLSQLLNDNLALQGQCETLTARFKFLEEFTGKERSIVPPANARSDDSTHCPNLSQLLEKNLRSQPPSPGNFHHINSTHPPTDNPTPISPSPFPHPSHPSPSLTKPIPLAIQIPSHQTAHGEMYKENAVREVRLKNLLPIHRSKIKGSRGAGAKLATCPLRPGWTLVHWKPATILTNYQKLSNISSHLAKLLSFLKPIV